MWACLVVRRAQEVSALRQSSFRTRTRESAMEESRDCSSGGRDGDTMKTAILLTILQLSVAGGDAWNTHRNLQTGKEMNPVARPFVSTTSRQIAYFSVTTGIKLVIPHLLKPKHPKLARNMQILGIADNATAWALSSH